MGVANDARGFTLIELLVVIAIIGVLASVAISNLRSARESANVAKAGITQNQMTKAIELYFFDMGFYPPDVNRGWDPGFAQPLPSNPDEAAGEPPGGSYSSPGTNCSHCPADWQDIIAQRWTGPYLNNWPRFTPWNGKYDYNYWGDGATRSGCNVSPGIYVGVQGDYDGSNTLPASAEQKMINKGFESENCMNGESQMLLWSLE